MFAVTEVSGLLHHHPTWSGLAHSLVVFVPLWWAWVGTSIHANTHDVDNAVDRLGIFAVGLCGLFMALAVPDAYGHRGLLYGGAYLVLRYVLGWLVFRGRGVTLNAFSVAMVVTGPLLVVGGLLHGGWRIGLWALTFVYTRWRMFRTMGWSRLAAGMLCGALLPALLHAPALATLGALATVLIGLNAVEALIIRPRMRDRRAAVARESAPALDRP